MTSHKSTQSPQDRLAPDRNVEIITPLKVRSPSVQGDPFRPWRATAAPILFFLMVLGIMAAGGFFFHPPSVETSGEIDRTCRSDGAVGNRRLREGGPEVSPDG
ncbi:MAG: hypothetical protein WBG61_11310 [Desulfobacterales bacterium]